MKRAISLTEVLVVTAVICVLVALIYPVLQKARGRAQVTVCASNLHSMHIAITMYRTEHDGAESGTARAMGFPPPWTAGNIIKPLPKCSAAPYYTFSAKYPYLYMAVDPPNEELPYQKWEEVSKKWGDGAYFLADLNHNDRNRPPVSAHFPTRATAVTVGGSVRTFVRNGNWELITDNFWEP